MALNIDKLLKQKGWTGQELGILEITVTLEAFKNVIQGNDKPPLVSPSELQKMLKTIEDPTEGAIYNGYMAIHEWLSKVYNVASTQQQQADLRYNEFFHRIINAETAEKLYQYIEKLPVIMTEKQYSDFLTKRKDELLHPDTSLEY